MRTNLEEANLATINIQSVFSNFHGEITEAMLSNIIENAREVEAILRGAGLFDSALAEKMVELERAPKQF